jgi:putative molybdopterin biosynthesis protein
MQGVVFRPDSALAACTTAEAAVNAALADPTTLMVNRNVGSGTRILIDRLLGAARPPGYAYQAKSHNGVAVAVLHGRADWGLAIETVARQYGLGFLPLQVERYDFVIPTARIDRAAVQRFVALLNGPTGQQALHTLGFHPAMS